MTNLLNVPAFKLQGQPSLSFLKDAQDFLDLNRITHCRTAPSTTQFLLPLRLLRSCSGIKVFYHYESHVVIMRAQLCHESGMQVKASSVHQKTLLIKLAMARNQKNDKIQVKIQPLTGAVQLNCNFWAVESVEGKQVARQLLHNLENSTEIITHILEVLEQIPAESQNNNFYTQLLNKLHVVRPLILNAKTCQLSHATNEQIFHQAYFSFVEQPNFGELSLINYNLLQKIKKTYVEEFLSMFVHNGSKTKQYNLLYMNLDLNMSMQSLLKSVQHDNILPEGESAEQKFESEGKGVILEYGAMRPENINYHYSTLDKITKKKLYYSFLKQYVLLPNHLKITSKYVLSKVEQEPTQNLRSFINKNRISMSFDTQLRIISQILAISCICLERTDNFAPSFNLSNFSIDKFFEFKLNNLSKCQFNPKMTVLQSMYQVLFQRQFYLFRGSELIVNKMNSLQSQNLKHMGPSPVAKLLIKSMQNLEKTIVQNMNADKKELENLLLITNKFLSEYEKAVESVSNRIQSLLL